MTFMGFPEDKSSQIRIPEGFFRQVLYEIDDVDELKVTLYIFWRLDRMEGPLHYLRLRDLFADSKLVGSMRSEADTARIAIVDAIQKAIGHGTLLQTELVHEERGDMVICLNSPKGRALVDAIQRGEWKDTGGILQPADIYAEHPNIFQLYEANIGPLTPMIADALRDAEKTYHSEWIEDAFQIAVERNKRNWHYIEAILHRWQEGGRDDRKEKQNRRNTEEARRRYGEWEK
jgi:DnaD/phage-associated family protein